MGALKNGRQETFCQITAASMGKTPASEAYRLAGYEAEDGNSAEACASRLLSDAKVQERIQELKAARAEEYKLDRDRITAMMLETFQLARDKGQTATMARVGELLGSEYAGMFVKKSEVGQAGDFAKLSDTELRNLALKECQALGSIELSDKLSALLGGVEPEEDTAH